MGATSTQSPPNCGYFIVPEKVPVWPEQFGAAASQVNVPDMPLVLAVIVPVRS